MLKVKLEALREYELEAVNQVAEWYTEALKDRVKTPIVPEGFYSSWAQYTIQLKDEQQRDVLQKKLKEQNIPTMIYYPKPLHEQTVYKEQGLKQYVECPVTERLCRTVLALPMDPYKADREVNIICKTIVN